MVEKTKDDLLDKIQKLMAKAESTEFEAERETFMRAAENLMNKYRIELWEIQQREAGRIQQRDPIVKDFDYGFAFDSGPFPEICDALWALFVSLSRHANCVIVYHKQHYSGEAKVYKGNVVPVIGTESDLGYFSLLFASLMSQLIEATHPKADPNVDVFTNLKMFREAGIGWDEAGESMQAAGFRADEERTKARDTWIRFYRSECKKRGVEQNYNNWKTYRRNFASGFASQVSVRLSEMRKASSQETSSGGTGMDLVLRSQNEINRAFMAEEFPDNGGRAGSSAMVKHRKYDAAAQGAGHAAGARASIQVNPSAGLKGRKAIDK
jgi:hypothetical protein